MLGALWQTCEPSYKPLDEKQNRCQEINGETCVRTSSAVKNSSFSVWEVPTSVDEEDDDEISDHDRDEVEAKKALPKSLSKCPNPEHIAEPDGDADDTERNHKEKLAL